MRGNLLLILTALIWGCAFVAQDVGMEKVGPLTFSGCRFLVSLAVLIPLVLFRDHRERRLQSVARSTETSRLEAAAGSGSEGSAAAPGFWQSHGGSTLLRAGFLCGIVLAFAANLQQIGIQYAPVGKAGFITTLYILIVPIIGLFFGKKISKKLWLCVGIAIVGLYLLCNTEGGSFFSYGDVLLMLSAFGFAVQIMIIDYFSPKVDPVLLSTIQMAVCGTLTIILAFLFEDPSMPAILSAWKSILYAGLLSSGVAYTLQIVAQRDTDPVVASLLMSLESSFALLAGFVLLHQTLTPRELCGCGLMFLAIMLAQIPDKNADSSGGKK